MFRSNYTKVVLVNFTQNICPIPYGKFTIKLICCLHPMHVLKELDTLGNTFQLTKVGRDKVVH